MIKQIILNFLKGYKYIILDVPLLFEVKSALKFISYKIVVDCDEETQLERLLSRNPELSQEDAWHVEVLYQFKISIQIDSGKISLLRDLNVLRIKFLCNIVQQILLH